MNREYTFVMACLFGVALMMIIRLMETCDFLAEELAMADAENDFLFHQLAKEVNHG